MTSGARSVLRIVAPALVLYGAGLASDTRAQAALLQVETGGRIGEELAPRNAPFLVARPDGRVTLGCVEWTPGAGDRIELRDSLQPDGTGAPPRHVSEVPREIVRPIGVVDAAGRLNVLWTEPLHGCAQIAWAREREGGFTPPAVLTSGPLPNMNPEATLGADGHIYVVWEADVAEKEGERSNRDVLLAPLLEEGRLGDAVRVGDGRFSDLDAGVVHSGGRLWTVWAAYAGHDYEIRLRSFDPASGRLGDTIAVSDDPMADDLHPCLAAASGGDLWVAWDRVEVTQRGSSTPAELRVVPCPDYVATTVQCACLHDGRMLVPPTSGGVVPGAPKMSTGGGVPRLAFDRGGRLWIAYRYLLHPGGRMQTSFPLLLQSLSATGWSAPLEVAGSGGLTEQAALVAQDDGVLVAGCRDGRGEADSGSALPVGMRETLARQGVKAGCWYGATSISLALGRANGPSVRRTEDAGGGSPTSPTWSERPRPVARAHDRSFDRDLDDPILSGAEHYEIRRGDERFLVFWGDLHRHSSISRCLGGIEPTASDRWASGRDVHLCDFMALTDHCSHTEPFSWWQLDKLVWLYGSDRFCTLAGFEWSTRESGHHNVILRGRLSPFVQPQGSLDLLYRSLPVGESITIPHHSAYPEFAVPFDLCEDGHSRLVEVYQAMRGNYEFDGCFKQAVTATALGSFVRDALQQGREFGLIASTDHGFGQAYACALAKRLDRASVFEALHARRTYAATVKGILVDFRIRDSGAAGAGADALMGESVELSHSPRIRLVAHGTAEFAEVAVIKDGRTFQSVGKRRETPSTLAPVRLVARTAAGGPPPEREWTLRIRSRGAHFGTLDDRRGFARNATVPTWTSDGEQATLVWPAGYAASGVGSQFPIHLFASEDATLEVTTADDDARLTFAELLRKPVKLRVPDGGSVILSLMAADAAIDLEHGLGTAEFAQEWTDDSSELGASWYYARIVQVDGEMAWSSPIFVKRK